MSSFVESLVEMGFSREKALKAVEVTGSQGVEPAIEWLVAHSDEMAMDTSDAMEATTPADSQQQPAQLEGAQSGEESEQSAAGEAKSYKCNECGKLFKTSLEMQYHATKSGHTDFAESTEEKKPLTEEEKKEQLRRLEEKMRQKRLEREENEKKEALEKEKDRIRSGKEIAAAKKKMEDDEIKKLVEQRKRDKIEEKLARERVKQQIEQDKIARRAKFGMASPDNEAPAQPVSLPPPPSEPPAPVVHKDYSETRIQIRLTNGQALTQVFGSKEQLSAVRLYIEMNRTDGQGPFTLMTNFPKKVFSDEDYEKPLDILGLVPSAVIIVSKAATVF